VRRAIDEARGEADNPFESVLRAIALDVPGLAVRPQVAIGRVRPDLVDEELRVVLEADSFEWHGNRAALRRDARRYNLLVVDGWTVLRFAWEDVMFEQAYVRSVLVDVVQAHTEVGCRCRHSA
jgi:very-short-patch-repair endonuclease